MAESSREPSNRWATLRDICSAVRELAIVLAMVILLVAPSFVRDSLERAGIRSVAGVEFDVENLAQSREELVSALAQVDSLKSQLDSAQQQIQGLASSGELDSPAINAVPGQTFSREPSGGGAPFSKSAANPSLASVSRLLDSMRSKAEETDRSLRRSKDHADQVLEQAGRKIQLTPPEVLFGSDPSANSASARLTDDEDVVR